MCEYPEDREQRLQDYADEYYEGNIEAMIVAWDRAAAMGEAWAETDENEVPRFVNDRIAYYRREAAEILRAAGALVVPRTMIDKRACRLLSVRRGGYYCGAMPGAPSRASSPRWG